MPYIAQNAEMKHAENRMACARLVESNVDGEEVEGSMVASTRELSRYKTCLKKTRRADTLVPEVRRFDGKKLDIVDSIGDHLDDINEASVCSVNHSFGWKKFKVLVLQLRMQEFLHPRSKVPARSCKAFVNWTMGYTFPLKNKRDSWY